MNELQQWIYVCSTNDIVNQVLRSALHMYDIAPGVKIAIKIMEVYYRFYFTSQSIEYPLKV